MTQYEIQYSDEKITYIVERSKRKTLELSVLPDMSVIVIAPLESSLDDIDRIVRKRAHWILKQRDYFKQFVPKEPPRQYVSGETHRYLGRQYRLKVIESKEKGVKLQGKVIFITSDMGNDPVLNKKLLYKWYKEHAELKYDELIDQCLIKLKKYGIEKPEVTIRKMTSRWGSCDSYKKKIILNTGLIKAPSHCIEYVIMHELCHLKYADHDNRFYKFLTLVMPDWKGRKDRLEKAFL
ncbi:MAG TPA: SprT family zinc-dependent metalloprotease [Spirochaetota bacterium]|nr:SprT family zinc-dependent metalloprotease [Spirochaetota bacterium]